MTYHKANFTIADNDITYAGYSKGTTWNGWACPLFTKEIAKEILNNIQAYQWSYDEKEDFFIFVLEKGNEVETIESIEITVDNEVIKVYRFDNLGFCWDQKV